MSLLSNWPPLMMSAGEWDDFCVQIASIWFPRSWCCGDDRDGLIIGVLCWVILSKQGAAEWPQITCTFQPVETSCLLYRPDPCMGLDGLQSWHWLHLWYINVCHQMWWNKEKGRRWKSESLERKVKQYVTGCLCCAFEETTNMIKWFWLDIIKVSQH